MNRPPKSETATHRSKQRIIIIVVIVVLVAANLAARLSLPPQPSPQLALSPQLGLLAFTHGRIDFVIRLGRLFTVEVAGRRVGADEFLLQSSLGGMLAECKALFVKRTFVSRSISSSSTPSATASSSSATSSLKSNSSSSARSMP